MQFEVGSGKGAVPAAHFDDRLDAGRDHPPIAQRRLALFVEEPMTSHIVAVYASVLALVFVLLSVRTLRMRRTLRIAIGDAGNEALLRAMRVHSNFAEYVPLSLLLLYFVETSGAWPWLVHSLGLALVAGRCAHAYGVSQVNEDYRFRVFGMSTTFATLLTCAAYLLLVGLAGQGA